ncbi:hypothetical protein OOJ09_23540 [Mesorhizobium qingshengii]|uniref:Acyltransferase family protein n=1 Tax=Mesorhizobium qingshengii TaxID=1165689 RepID=A0ABT4R092_9HYPH|nr:hypothetical protein [Mesorhizobium qingshengii]MCZ8547174.1 hypothetical protein [Mesorhizobium qingshengii]
MNIQQNVVEENTISPRLYIAPLDGLRFFAFLAVLSTSPMRYLGRISYGLYVFHFVFIGYSVGRVTKMLGHPIAPANSAGDYWLMWLTALTLTVVAASISYFAFEKWIAQFKRRYEAVEGRRP